MTERDEEKRESEAEDEPLTNSDAGEIARSGIAGVIGEPTGSPDTEEQSELETQPGDELVKNFRVRLFAALEKYPEGTHRRLLFYEILGYNLGDATEEVEEAFDTVIDSFIASGEIVKFKSGEGKSVFFALSSKMSDEKRLPPRNKKRGEPRPKNKPTELLVIPVTFEKNVKKLLKFQGGRLHLNDLRVLFPNFEFPLNDSIRAPYIVLFDEMKKLIEKKIIAYEGGGWYITPALSDRESYQENLRADHDPNSPRDPSLKSRDIDDLIKDANLSSKHEEKPKGRGKRTKGRH